MSLSTPRLALAPWLLLAALCLAAAPAAAQPVPPPPPPDDPGLPVAAPEQPASVVWFYIRAGAKLGPVTTPRVRQLVLDGEITTTTKLWRAGMAGWLPMSTLPEFADMAAPPVPTTSTGSRRGIPKGPQPKRIRSRGMIISGAITFGASWLTAVLASVLMADGGDDEKRFAEVGWIPIAGPIAGYQVSDPDSTSLTIITVFWGLAQATGVALFTAGMIGSKNPHYVEPADKGKGEKKAALRLSPRAGDFMVSPMVGNMNGFGFTTHF